MIIVTGVLYLLSYLDSRYLILKKLVSKYTFFGGNLYHYLPTYYRHLRYVFRIQALHATIFLKLCIIYVKLHLQPADVASCKNDKL